MEENSNVAYTRGFNNGYLLAKYEPILLEQITKQVPPSGEYLEGLFSGKDEYELEHHRAQLDELSRLRDSSKEQDRNLDLP